MLSWLKRIFGKKEERFSNYDRIQEKLIQQELALLRQEMPEPTRKRRSIPVIWTPQMLADWRDNAKRVHQMHVDYWTRQLTA